ncbi:MAG: peptidylprolyl isomerase [Bacilli bacterium]
MAKKKQETKNNKKEKKEEIIKEEKIVKEKEKKESKKEENKETKKVKKNNDDKVFKIIEFFDKYRLAIYGAVGGILLTILVVIIIWPDRIATLKDGTQPVAEIDGYTLTADILYEDMKEIYSISSLLDKIDNEILEEKYPETEEMNDELKEEAENYYNIYEQYYQMDKETFLSNNFGSEKAFIEYLRLQYRRNKYTEDYIKSLISDKEIEKYYNDKVYGDINTKHILVKVDSSASDEDKEEAEKLAKEIISKLDSGKTFDEVKEEYKDKITYEELGYKSYNANLESAYMEAMQKLENNSYSKEPVKTSYGYHIIYRIDQKEKPELTEVKEEILDSLVKEKESENENIYYIALDKMRNDAGLKFYDTVLEKKYNTYVDQNK